jgi:two-component sensor histidine kinase
MFPPAWLKVERGGIGFRLALSLSLAMLPIGLLAVFESVSSFRRSHVLEEQAAIGAAEEAIEFSSKQLNEAVGVTAGLGVVLAQRSAEPEGRCEVDISDLVPRGVGALSAAFVTSQQVRTCAVGRLGPEAIDGMLRPDITLRNTNSVIYVGTERTDAVPAVMVVVPVTPEEEPAGWAISVWPEAHFFRANVPDNRPDTSIVDGTGTVFAAVDEDKFPAAFSSDILDGRKRRVFNDVSRSGEHRLFVALPLYGTGLTALATMPLPGAITFDRGTYFWTLLLPLLMWGVSLFVAFVSTNRLATGPLRQLEKMTWEMSEGARDFTSFRLKGAPNELQCLSDRFVEMAGRVNSYESSLERALADKTFLLREVHHRVRNNLQLLVSILNMQERISASDEAKNLLAQFRRRVFGLAAAHETLFGDEQQTANSARTLIASAANSALTVAGYPRLEPRYDVEPLALSTDTMVPLALFLSEATADAIRFSEAFGQRPDLRLEFSRDDGTGRLLLTNTVSPDVAGDRLESAQSEQDQLSGKLMLALSRQLDGSYTAGIAGNVYTVDLRFKLSG